jgi:hypothetical protein
VRKRSQILHTQIELHVRDLAPILLAVPHVGLAAGDLLTPILPLADQIALARTAPAPIDVRAEITRPSIPPPGA